MAKLTTADRLVLKEAYERVCPLQDLADAVHRCMNTHRSAWQYLHSRLDPWRYCAQPMTLLQDCDREQRRFLADNRDSLSRAMLFRDTLEHLLEAKDKGLPSHDLDRKVGQIRKEFRLILDAKKAAKSAQQQQQQQQQAQQLSKKEEKVRQEKQALQEAHEAYLSAQVAYLDKYITQAPRTWGRIDESLRRRHSPHLLGGAL